MAPTFEEVEMIVGQVVVDMNEILLRYERGKTNNYVSDKAVLNKSLQAVYCKYARWVDDKYGEPGLRKFQTQFAFRILNFLTTAAMNKHNS